MFTGHCERPRAGSKLSIGLKPVDFSVGLMLVDSHVVFSVAPLFCSPKLSMYLPVERHSVPSRAKRSDARFVVLKYVYLRPFDCALDSEP